MTLGLDELMIVNPGPAAKDDTWFLGDDGGLYRMARPGEGTAHDAALGDPDAVPRFFLGDDGTLYERT
jgi:hypothetical protein